MFDKLRLAFRNRLTDQVCPYCFETFRLKATPFRCANDAARCSPERDDVYARGPWGTTGSPILGKVVPPRGGLVSKATCGSCGDVTRDRLCPHCHMTLPSTLGEADSYIFALVGGPFAGKSHYIATLLRHLEQEVAPDHGLLLEALDDDTMYRRANDFDRYIYKERRVIPKTDRAGAGGSVRHPLVYGLSFLGTDVFGRKRIRKVVTLVFFDTAGEDLHDQANMGVVNRYIYRADGLILLVDPLQVPAVRDRLEGRAELPDINLSASDVVTRVTSLIRRGRGLGPADRVATPLAVAFSKFDAVDQLLGDQLQVTAPRRRADRFDAEDHRAVSDEMRAVLSDWNEKQLLQQVEVTYRDHAYFGVSALGHAPDSGGRLSHVLPRRVGDPFLWLLRHHGLIGDL